MDAQFTLNENNPIEANLTIKSAGVTYHPDLTGRGESDQHPISAITDLTETLAGLRSDIDDEETRAKAAEQDLSDDIIAENTRAVDAEEALGERIDDLSSYTSDEVTRLEGLISAEEDRAELAEGNLSGRITAEVGRAEGAESALGTRISNVTNGTTNIDYDNTVSGLTAVTIKGALDEIQSNVEAETLRAETVEGDIDDLTTSEKSNLVGAINELDSTKQDNLSAGTGIDITSNTVSVTTPTLINSATGADSLTVLGTTASQSGVTNVGVSAQGKATNSTAVGYSASAEGVASTAIGKSANARAARSIALGALSYASGDFSIAIGSHNSLYDSSAKATAQSSIQLGNGINSTANTFQVGSYTLLNTSTGIIPNARIDIDSTPTENSTNTVSSGGTYTMVNNVITGTTDIDYDNTTSGLSANTIKGAIDELDSNVDDIEDLIPSEATSTNQLADKSFVNSSIATNTANFIGTFNSVAELEAYSGTLTNNDYAFVITTDSLGNIAYDRYKYTEATTPASWVYEYTLNNSSFTSSQWAAINSGANTTNIGQITTNQNAIGTLSSLTTTAQNNLVAAINELDSDKQENITGAATSIASSDLTASKALVSDSNGKVAVSSVTSTELGYISGVTSAVQNQLDGKVDENAAITGDTKCKITYDSKGLVTAGADLQASDIPSLTLSKISDVTASASEVNILDGVTASTAELNILDGVTASTAEINVLDGLTATTTELNYTDGVTSNIQTQLDGKQATLVSGTNIKTVNSTSLLGSGDVAVQETLVSGTNIKTINNNSILGSGDLAIDGLPSQTGQSGKFLSTDGTNPSWQNVDALPSQTGQSGKYLTTDGTNPSWNTITIPSVDVDGISINRNTDNELQTVGVINSRDSSTAIKTWTGTKTQYDAIVTKDANTLYNITDDADVSLTILEALYPVGSIYITTNVACPLSTLIAGSTWVLVSSGIVTAGDIPCKGNGMTLGLTNGTQNGGLSYIPSAYMGTFTDTYGTDVQTTTPTTTAVLGRVGITTDQTKSGIIADTSSLTLAVNIFERTN